MNLEEPNMKSKIITYGLIVILLIALFASLKAWYGEKNKPIISKVEFVKVPEIKVVTKIKKVEVPMKVDHIVTIQKDVLIKKVNGLPTWFVGNADEEAIAMADLPESKSGYEVMGTMNTKTGVGNIIAKEKQRSLFGLPNEKEIGARVGYSMKGQQVSIYGRWNFFRVGNMHLSAYGEGNSEGNATAQLELGYRF